MFAEKQNDKEINTLFEREIHSEGGEAEEEGGYRPRSLAPDFHSGVCPLRPLSKA